MIPIGERALAWIERYQLDVRPELVATRNQNALFLTTLGEAFTPSLAVALVLIAFGIYLVSRPVGSE